MFWLLPILASAIATTAAGAGASAIAKSGGPSDEETAEEQRKSNLSKQLSQIFGTSYAPPDTSIVSKTLKPFSSFGRY
jgi:hypothetical protein